MMMSGFNDQDVFEKKQVEAEFLLIPAPNSQYQYIDISLQMCIIYSLCIFLFYMINYMNT